jgi:hypothetical protein
VLPSLEPMWARLRALSPAPEPVAERA